MSNLNLCQFTGRLGKDVEMRYLPDGKAMASLTLAVGSQWKNKSGEKQEATEWVNITAFGKLAEICGEYLVKGSPVYISGKLKTDKYKAKDGTDRYSTKIIAENLEMFGGKPNAHQDTQQPANEPKKVVIDDRDPFAGMDSDLPF